MPSGKLKTLYTWHFNRNERKANLCTISISKKLVGIFFQKKGRPGTGAAKLFLLKPTN
jgi:hypothetical protein